MHALWKIGCLAAIVLTLGGPPGWAETSETQANLFNQPQLDGITLSFIYEKMNNVTPDFRPYAQQSIAYTHASVFARDKVFSDQMESLQKRFVVLDVHGTYVARLNVQLKQYDPTSHAYGTGFGESSYIPVRDPVTYQEFGVQFTNRPVIEKIPVAPDAAEAYARRFSLPVTGSYVGSAILQLAFRLDTVPPAVGSNVTMMNATILAARLYTNDGRLMHEFAVAAPANSSSSSSDVLKAADLQGLKLSMPIDAAISGGKAGWTAQRGGVDEHVVLFFNGLEQRTPRPAKMFGGMPSPFAGEWAVCAGQQSGRQDPDERGEGRGPPSFHDCVALVEKAGSITQISSEQHFSNLDVTTLMARLDAQGCSMLLTEIWIGSFGAV
jgi:hypothetical protein